MDCLRSMWRACRNVRTGDQCCGRAVQHRKPWVVSDTLTDPLFASARDAALRSRVRAAFSVPVVNEASECLGSFACHYGEPISPLSEKLSTTQSGQARSPVIFQHKAAGLTEFKETAPPCRHNLACFVTGSKSATAFPRKRTPQLRSETKRRRRDSIGCVH
jgi:hypothetical protein